MVRKGDTLIEVCIAIGIFSLVAIGVASVMSSGTSGSQTALETTLTREEIDTQAEALRFVHSAYMASKNVSSTAYTSLWNEIASNAIESKNFDPNYAPTDCKALYDGDTLIKQRAFVLNPRALNSGSSAYVSIRNQGDKFRATTTYPRLLYGSSTDGLLESGGTNISYAEGLYVVAVRDGGTNMVVGSPDPTSTSAFYDFYIRSCWYGTDSDRPATISTVIRLYDPPASSGAPAIKDKYERWSFKANTFGSNFIQMPNVLTLYAGESATIPAFNSRRFKYWIEDPGGLNKIVHAGDRVTAADPIESNIYHDLYAELNFEPFYIYYDPNGGTIDGSTDQVEDGCTEQFSECEARYYLKGDIPTPVRSGYKFEGWSTRPDDSEGRYQTGGYYGTLPITDTENTLTFYAIWKPYFTIIIYDTDETTELCRYGAYVATQKVHNCGRDPSNPGGGQGFQGWSPDDREPYYQDGDTIAVPDYGDRTIRLYPVWRVSIKFSSEGWTQSASLTRPDTSVFNYEKPATGSYTTIRAGRTYGSYNTAPADGYIVGSNGKNIEVLDSGIINLQGFYGTCSHGPYSAGVYYDVGKDDTFELSAKMNTNGMHNHPGGSVDISIGPVTATITKASSTTSVASNCRLANGTTRSGSSASYSNNSVINLKIAKHSNDYDIYVGGTMLVSCNVPTTNNVKVGYVMNHSDHCCSEIFNTQLYDIEMQQYKK